MTVVLGFFVWTYVVFVARQPIDSVHNKRASKMEWGRRNAVKLLWHAGLLYLQHVGKGVSLRG